jgi:hypothetical protein
MAAAEESGERRALAARAFERTLSVLDVDLGDDDPEVFGRRAALRASASSVWRDHLGPLLTSSQAQELLVVSRAALNLWVKQQKVLALPRASSGFLYPAFQFSQRTGRPYEAVAGVIERLAPAVDSPYTIASFFVTAEGLLDGKTPAEWMQEGGADEPLFEAARRSAGVLSH